MSPSIADVTRDLIDEQHDLDRIVSSLLSEQFAIATPSPGWTVADQLGHLAYFDTTAALAINDPEAFVVHRSELFAAPSPAGDDLDAATLGNYRVMDSDALVAAWRSARSNLESAARSLGNGDRVEWYGPSMGAKSFLTARLMEAWAHGQDIADAVGVERTPSTRLVHIAQLGVITQKWSFIVRGEEPLAQEVTVSLDAPDGTTWDWGDSDAQERVTGPAEDFCLVVTQRRHVDDTDLVVLGSLARQWMEHAQAFAGGPTAGPAPSGGGRKVSGV